MAVDSEPVPDERVDPSAVDTLPADLPGDFNLAMPSPTPSPAPLSALDARILELQHFRCNLTISVFVVPCATNFVDKLASRQRLDARPFESAVHQVPH